VNLEQAICPATTRDLSHRATGSAAAMATEPGHARALIEPRNPLAVRPFNAEVSSRMSITSVADLAHPVHEPGAFT